MKQLTTDILVIGGGSAGVAAAYSAAGLHDVILIEKLTYLGGKATGAEVGTVCGLYFYSKSDRSEYVAGGFSKLFAETLAHKSMTNALSNSLGLHYLPYSIEAYKTVCSEFLDRKNIRVLFNAQLNSVEKTDSILNTATVKVNGEDIRINYKAIIDCSGDNNVSDLANLPQITSKTYQTASQVFTVCGIKEMSETNLTFLLMKELRAAVLSGKADKDFEKVYVVQGSFINSCASFKLNVPMEVTYLPGNREALSSLAKQRVHDVAEYLRNNVPAFENSELTSMAPELGLRVGKRGLGKYVLTESDVLSCKKFDSAIANGAWPIEEWGNELRVNMRYFKENDYYQIPAECLQSEHSLNLFFAGRVISADDSAIASARVMGTCLQTGYAAGQLASAYCSGTDYSQAIRYIQQTQFFV